MVGIIFTVEMVLRIVALGAFTERPVCRSCRRRCASAARASAARLAGDDGDGADDRNGGLVISAPIRVHHSLHVGRELRGQLGEEGAVAAQLGAEARRSAALRRDHSYFRNPWYRGVIMFCSLLMC